MGASDDIESPRYEAVDTHTDKTHPDKGHVEVGRQNLSNVVHPHDSYEGGHRFDPFATWTEEEERRAVRKTDIRLLVWLCVMVSSPDCIKIRVLTDSAVVLRTSIGSWQSVQCLG
jgi:hypothetical protein